MKIPLEQTEKDIFSYGFDKSLNRERELNAGPVYDYFKQLTDTSVIPSGGNLNVKSLSAAGFVKTISPGDDIQAAIDSVSRDGGGRVFLRNGTYKQTTPLVGRSDVDLEGENSSTTIIDFSDSSANLSYAGTSVYATGTITSITSGVNVTGSGTAWLANVTNKHQFFIGNTWYRIALVTSDTTLVLDEGYQQNATLPGATYRTAIIPTNVDIKNLTFRDSSGTAITITDARNFRFNTLYMPGNNKAMTWTNTSEFLTESITIASSVSNGFEITNARLCNIHRMALASNGGHGMVANNYTTGVVIESSSTSNTSDGFNFTSCSDVVLSEIEASANGGQGIEMVSGNDNNIMGNGVINANTSDGIKLTATSDNCHIGNFVIKNNGGYGVNIAASTCDNNLIHNNVFSNNTSGGKNDSGTGTLLSGNVPDTVNNTAAGITLTNSSLTTGEAIDGSTTPQIVCVKAADGLIYKADANDNTLVDAYGFVTTNASITTTPAVTVNGVVTMSGLTVGATYYVSDTAGTISSTPSSTTSIPVGIALSATKLLVVIGKKIAYGTITHSSAAAGTQDVTTTIGFRPSIIMLGIQDMNITGTTAALLRGSGYFQGTTSLWVDTAKNDGLGTAVTSTNLTSYSNTNSLAISSLNNPDKATATLSINSTSDTGFVTRIVNATDAGAGGNSSATLKYIAYE